MTRRNKISVCGRDILIFCLFIILFHGCRLVEDTPPYTLPTQVPYTDDKVISPAAGDIITRGSVMNIKWTGMKGPGVSLDLWKKKQYFHQVISNSENSGTYSWHVPEDTPPSTYYQVKITASNNSSYYIYSGVFTIR